MRCSLKALLPIPTEQLSRRKIGRDQGQLLQRGESVPATPGGDKNIQ
jgi:hypothetical protein